MLTFCTQRPGQEPIPHSDPLQVAARKQALLHSTEYQVIAQRLKIQADQVNNCAAKYLQDGALALCFYGDGDVVHSFRVGEEDQYLRDAALFFFGIASPKPQKPPAPVSKRDQETQTECPISRPSSPSSHLSAPTAAAMNMPLIELIDSEDPIPDTVPGTPTESIPAASSDQLSQDILATKQDNELLRQQFAEARHTIESLQQTHLQELDHLNQSLKSAQDQAARDTQARNQEIDQLKQSLKSTQDQAARDIQARNQEIDQLNQLLKSAQDQAARDIQARNQEIDQLNQLLKSAQDQAALDTQARNQEISQLKQALKSTQDQAALDTQARNQEIDQLNQLLKSAQDQVARRLSEQKERDRAHQELEASLRYQMTGQAEQSARNHAEFAEKLQAAEESLKTEQEKIFALRERISQLDRENMALLTQMASTEETLKTKMAQIQQAQQALIEQEQQSKATIAKLHQELQNASIAIAAANEKNAQAQVEIARLKAELREALTSLQAMLGRYKALRKPAVQAPRAVITSSMSRRLAAYFDTDSAASNLRVQQRSLVPPPNHVVPTADHAVSSNPSTLSPILLPDSAVSTPANQAEQKPEDIWETLAQKGILQQSSPANTVATMEPLWQLTTKNWSSLRLKAERQ